MKLKFRCGADHDCHTKLPCGICLHTKVIICSNWRPLDVKSKLIEQEWCSSCEHRFKCWTDDDLFVLDEFLARKKKNMTIDESLGRKEKGKN